jgi:hypothetical protein
MIFFLCNAPGCFVHLLILQVFFLQVFSTTCYLSNSFSFVDSVRDHSKVSVRLQVFKFTFFKYKSSTFSTFMMPVVTRSMSKYSASDKIMSETSHPTSSTIHLQNTTTNSAIVSTSYHDVSASSFSSLPLASTDIFLENQFEISNAANLEFSNFCRPHTVLVPNGSSQNFRIESKCDDNATMKIDPDPPDSQESTQDGIMKMLMAISSQMMANTQDLQDKITKNTLDLQDQLLQNDLKLTTEIQCIKQDHDAFKQEIRDELLHLHSGGPPSSNSLMNNIASSTQTVPTITPLVVAFNPAPNINGTTPNNSTTSVSNDVFQSQMLQLLNDTFSKLSTVITDTKNDTKTE